MALGLLVLMATGLWMQMQYREDPMVNGVQTEVRLQPTATNTSLALIIPATRTSLAHIVPATNTVISVTEVPLPTPTLRQVATQIPSPTMSPSPSVTMTPPPATATPLPAKVSRLVIESIRVDAPVVEVGIVDGVMEAPSTSTDVGWSNFSARPGEVGNIVFSGHLDSAIDGPAVFYRLGDLVPGDTVEVHTEDGGVAMYRVTDSRIHPGNEDIWPLVSPTGTPTITLITCDGTFDQSIRQYDERLVVTGELVTGSE